MDTVGECSSKKGTRRQNTGKRPVRKRSSRNRKQTSVSQLIQQLRETVFPDPDAQATRHQVLQTAKLYIQQLENTLDSLLKMRGRCQTEDSGCCSLEDIKEEYLQLYHIDQGGAVADKEEKPDVEPVFWFLEPEFSWDLEEVVEDLQISKPQTPEAFSSPDLVEFDRYLHFYTQTVDVLVENSVVSPEQVTHPVVSKAIFSLWQDLSQEGKANIYQYGIPQASSTPCSLTYPSGTGCTIRDSGAESQEATSSFLSSTPEEVLYDDAFDVVSDFLAQNTDQMMHSPRSPPHGSSPLESLEGYSHLYQQITGFLRTRLSSYTQASVLQCDYETVLLRCTETFEDEDDL
ncbi:stimulated by retinoic acid gene 8 protein homolog isoform X1 [Pseudophryne corroboree]|uniref:stimulated by retinoic acid gene 8 protein homolog isoform X1 n=1 Tax=Pseudophryne corroboree TaxID=495146 RepID=UPI0030814F1E